MTRHYVASLVLLTTALFSPSVVDVACGQAWRAGAAKIEITPEQPMWMAGYASRDHAAEGKLTELWAKALVLEDSTGHRAALVTLDLIGIRRELSLALCASLKSQYGLQRDQIALCTSHTHTGPVVGKNLRPMHYDLLDDEQKRLVDEYTEALQERIIGVVGQAMKRLAPASLSWASGTATFAVNRRNNREPDVPQLRADGKLAGPVDHDVPVLAVRDGSGKLTAVAFGYACHSTVLSFYKWSGDYPGFAQQKLEASHPGCVALFWAGCGADQNPLPRRDVRHAVEYGNRLADAVDAVLDKDMQTISGGLRTSYQEIDLPLDTLPTREEIEKDTTSKNRYIAARAKALLAQLDSGRPLSPTYPYPVQLWRIGEQVQFITLGGEVVVDYAIRLKTELQGKSTWIAGYTNDVMAYIPSRRVLLEGGYEGGGAMIYYGLPAHWAPEVERTIVDEVHNQCSAAVPASAKAPATSPGAQ